MQRGSALIILTVLISLGLVGYLIFTNKSPVSPKIISPKVEESSKIYKSQSLGFEFLYDGYSVKEDSEEEFDNRGNGDFRKNFKSYVGYEPGKFVGAVVVLKDNSYQENPLTVWIFDNPSGLSIDNWYKNFWYYPFVWGDFTSMGKITLAPKDEVTVSGQIGKSGVIDYQPGKPKFVYVSLNEKMFLFRIIGEEGSKILESFKFLNNYTCPENGWENCMPILNSEAQIQCSEEALIWKKANCRNFQGAAL